MKALFVGMSWMDRSVTLLWLVNRPGPLTIGNAECLGGDPIALRTHNKRTFLDALFGGTLAYVGPHGLRPVFWHSRIRTTGFQAVNPVTALTPQHGGAVRLPSQHPA